MARADLAEKVFFFEFYSDQGEAAMRSTKFGLLWPGWRRSTTSTLMLPNVLKPTRGNEATISSRVASESVS
jgi:hypothetical protein